MSEQPLIQVEVAPTFKRSLRTLAKKYRSIRDDIQSVIEQREVEEREDGYSGSQIDKVRK